MYLYLRSNVMETLYQKWEFLYQRDVKIVHDFDAIFLIYKPIIDVFMKKSSLIDLNVFRKVLIVLGYFLINC